MEYRLLGNTGLKVSTLSFGFWATYGVKEGVDRCVSVMRICRAAGINFFDNAEAYGKENGDAETIMGQADLLNMSAAVGFRGISNSSSNASGDNKLQLTIIKNGLASAMTGTASKKGSAAIVSTVGATTA